MTTLEILAVGYPGEDACFEVGAHVRTYVWPYFSLSFGVFSAARGFLSPLIRRYHGHLWLIPVAAVRHGASIREEHDPWL